MGVVTRLLPAILLLVAAPAKADQVGRWRPLIEEASVRFSIPTSWIERVMRTESRGLTMLDERPIRSRAGAMGLMQLMPATWADMRVRLGLGADADDPRDNILAGTAFLRLMYDRFGYPGLFGAYNVGPGAYAAWLAGIQRLPRETVAYFGTVSGTSQPMSPASQSAAPPALFVVRRTLPEAQISPTAIEPQPLLFVVRTVGP